MEPDHLRSRRWRTPAHLPHKQPPRHRILSILFGGLALALILRKAREERDKILRDARVAYDRMMAEAREKGQSESDALVRRARELIEREKVSAIAEVKKEVARLAIEVASKVVGETLKSDTEQQKLIERYINDIEANRN